MEGLNEVELKMLLGDKDIVIAQLQKYIGKLQAELKALTPVPVKDSELP